MGDVIDDYLARLAAEMTVDAAARNAILEEVRGHLEEAAARLGAGGSDTATAEAQAIAAFGSVHQVAMRLNAVHPIDWSGRRLVLGPLWGVAVVWVLWTLLTYPLLVYFAIHQPQPSEFGALDPAAMLFDATPLAFGLFRVLTYGSPLVLLPFLLLYGSVPFVWGRRVRQGWKPGLAFGLGVVVGLPWLLPGMVYHWDSANAAGSLLSLLMVGGVWLLVPFAMLASWLGQRTAHVRIGRAAIARSLRAAQSRPARWRRLPAYLAAAVVLALLIAGNVWAWGQASAAARIPPVAAQLRAAQASVPFTIRRPGYLPRGLALSSAAVVQASCAPPCAVSLTYQAPGGVRVTLNESPAEASQTFPTPPHYQPLPTPPNYQVSDVSVGGENPVWWLGTETITERQINLAWSDGGMDYFLGSNGTLPLAMLKDIAASVQ
jgi:hypothetical protein